MADELTIRKNPWQRLREYVADVRTELSRTALRPTDRTTEAELAAVFADLESRAVEWARRGALPVDQIVLTRSIEMRYARQNHELAVQVGRQATAAVLARRFHQQSPHDRIIAIADGRWQIADRDAQAGARSPVRKLQLSGFGHRSNPERPLAILDQITNIVADQPFTRGVTRPFSPVKAGQPTAVRSNPQDILREMWRVTRPGGRIAAIDSDWGTLVVDTTDPRLEGRVVEGLQQLITNPAAAGR